MFTDMTVRSLRILRNLQSVLALIFALCTIYLTYFRFGLSLKYTVIAAGIFLLIIIGLQLSKPAALVPRKPTDELDADQKKVHRLLKKRWVIIATDAGLAEILNLGHDHTQVEVPKVLEVRPHPLGLELVVQACSGQPAQELVEKAEHLASAIGAEVRAKKIDPVKASYIIQLRDVLAGVRRSTISHSTQLIVGRAEDGEDAIIDLTEASHVIMQGMTRSGKSALCYTIFSQLYGQENIQLWGIDPNRVLLEPLGQATEPENFVLGNDPVAAVELLTRFTAIMDENLAMLSRLRIEALKDFTEQNPLQVIVLEEFPGLLRQAEQYDKSVGTKERISPTLRLLLGRLVSEGAKAGIRVVLIAQRADANIIDGATRGQFGTRITMGVDNGDAVRMLHPQATPEIVERVTGEDFPVGQCLFWKNRKQRIMQADFTPYSDYLERLGLPEKAEPNELKRERVVVS